MSEKMKPESAGQLLKLVNEAALLSQLAGQPIGAPTIDSTPIQGTLAPNLSFGPFDRLVLNLRSAFSVQALNSPEDVDTDGLAGSASEGGPFADELALIPQLKLTESGPAYLKYRVEAGAKSSGASAAGALGFEFAGEAAAILLDYRAHVRKQAVVDAVVADLASGARFPFHLEDVLQMAPSDGLAVRLRGSLQASATITWSDVFSTHLGDLLAQTASRPPVMLRVDAGASLTGSIAVEDDFIVVFTRIDATTWRIAVRKARQREIQATGSAGVTITFADAKQVAGLLDAYLTGVLSRPLATVKKLLTKTSLDGLSEGERALLDVLLERFGLSKVPGVLAEISTRVQELETKAAAAVQAIAQAKLETGFRYEYSRIDTGRSLFQARLDETRLRSLHKDLVWGRLNRALASTQGAEIETYLNEKSSTRKSAWGFSLGLGKWAVSGKDTKVFAAVDRLDQNLRVQRSYQGCRRYDADWVGRDWSWEVDFRADMPSFGAQAGTPKVLEFEFGLGLVWHEKGKRLTRDASSELLDTAELWGILDGSHVAETQAVLSALGPVRYEAVLQILVGKGVFRAILDSLADPTTATAPDAAAALAAAMPWWEKVRPISPRERTMYYRDVWAFLLSHPKVERDNLLATARKILALHPGGEALAAWEGKPLKAPVTFMRLVEVNKGTPERFARMTRGFRNLRDAIRNGEPDNKRVPQVFEDLQEFWAQCHHARALGALLLNAADRQGVLPDVRRSLTVLPAEGDALVVASA